MKVYCFGGVMLLASTIAIAQGTANYFEVDFVRVDKSGKGYVNFKSPIIGEPASCTTTYLNALAFDTKTDGGKSILSVALTAQATGKKILAKGTGDCGVYGVMEDWNWGFVK